MADNSGNFWGGFLFGAAVGGVAGALVAWKLSEPEDEVPLQLDGDQSIDNPLSSNNEFARRTLERKIAQLNAAIDSVSKELATTDGKNGRKPTANDSLRDLKANE